MTEVSPSSKKVDDFLSSLSQLSQERLKEDRQRQRNLQRNIDELRSRSNSSSPVKGESTYRSSIIGSSYQISAPDLKFNRSKSARDDDFAPPLPRRRDELEEEVPPALPRRSTVDEEAPPRLPARKHQDSIGLLQPVARKETPVKPVKPKPVFHKSAVLPQSKDTEPGGHRSFRDIEILIKAGNASTRTLEEASAELPEPKSKPTKPDWLSSLSSSKSTVYTKQSSSTIAITPTKPKPTSWIDSAVSKSPESKPKTKAPFVKPSKPKHLELHSEPKGQEFKAKEPEPEFMTQFSKLKKPTEGKQKVPPAVKPKPKIKTEDEPPAEFQAKFNSITKPLPVKPKEKLTNYKENDSYELKSRLKKITPAKPEKPKFNSSAYEQQDSEELRAQLSKMAQKKPPKKPLKKAATEDFKPSVPQPLAKESTETNNAPENLSFEHKLGALLSQGPTLTKASTFPQTKATITKSNRQKASGNTLTHATKSRAKGPKRKLPKKIQIGGTAKSVGTIDSEKSLKVEDLATEEQQSNPDEESSTPIVKKPPPIKQKPKEIKVKPRVISGELFI
ncbi:hypothetical protein CORT_0D04700 [Candida orthopsilosis Co 90-125]|uniref:Uncharacterized protein n=1 Tax=Candida orthopsilosis (strain 90-125) TaxID=1136231 RepID=H8X662_CANO9|nr:hypothetical protein CORT_0D04700 [Candida orthopsilosis Co 90-125]CCG23310.1 hypothetical protein CORT_0D04700 [Candida orthopsilosis Co 90-125]